MNHFYITDRAFILILAGISLLIAIFYKPLGKLFFNIILRISPPNVTPNPLKGKTLEEAQVGFLTTAIVSFIVFYFLFVRK